MSSQGAGGPDLNLTRRSLLGRLGLTAAASAGAGALLAGRGAAPAGAMNHEEMVHVHGGAEGPVLRDGESFDPARANGFDPDRFLRHFDWGVTSKLPDGRTLREWEINAIDKDIEVAPGVFFPAWTYDGQVPGRTLRCNAGDLLRIHFGNGSIHPHTIHFHGIHTAAMDGVPGIGAGLIQPGDRTTYEFTAEPFGLHLFHCHANPLAEHIARGMYGTLIIDPPGGRPEADEMVMVQGGWNTNLDAQGNQFYFVNGIPFHYMYHPIRVKRDQLVRVYLTNMLEYDPINSFHLHANFFQFFPTGTSLEPVEFTDTISQVQGQRAVLEMRFPFTGKYMFHAHKSEFAELGWMGFFEVVD